MTWQAWVFTIGNVVFFLTLLPTVCNKEAYVPRLTSLPIALMLACYAMAFNSMAMFFAGTFCWLTVGAWAFVYWYRGTKPSPPQRSICFDEFDKGTAEAMTRVM